MKTLLWLVVLMTSFPLFGQVSDDNNMVAELASKDLNQRRVALHRIEGVQDSAKKEAIVASLLKLLERNDLDRTFEGTLHMSIDALGSLKSAKAIPILIKYLDFVPADYRIEELIPTEMYFPAAPALVKIGKPCIEYIENILSDKRANDISKKLAVWVIMEINGRAETLSQIKKSNKAMKFHGGSAIEHYVANYKQTFKHPEQLLSWSKDK